MSDTASGNAAPDGRDPGRVSSSVALSDAAVRPLLGRLKGVGAPDGNWIGLAVLRRRAPDLLTKPSKMLLSLEGGAVGPERIFD